MSTQMSTQYLTPPNRPLPKRLLSLQNPPQSPLGPRSTNPNTKTSSRPGAPRRSVSFCGDTSASTYALASANPCAHLSSDKRALVAPPLERTLSSIGSRGNHSQQMPRPEIRQPDFVMPLSPPSPFCALQYQREQSPIRSPASSSPAGNDSIPSIIVQTPSPSRPGLNPVQASPSRNARLPSLQHRSMSMASSSRSSSYTINTPSIEYSTPAPGREWLKSRHMEEEHDDDVEMVDGMIEGVEDLIMA